jgi:hypothetical protein
VTSWGLRRLRSAAGPGGGATSAGALGCGWESGHRDGAACTQLRVQRIEGGQRTPTTAKPQPRDGAANLRAFLAVEMVPAAFLAVAQFGGVQSNARSCCMVATTCAAANGGTRGIGDPLDARAAVSARRRRVSSVLEATGR